jgi:hypothetical protein
LWRRAWSAAANSRENSRYRFLYCPRRSLRLRDEDTLTGRTQENQDHHPERSVLCPDQAAGALLVLTDGQCVSPINAPAGSGNTRRMAEAARMWTAAGHGPVIGITRSQHPGRRGGRVLQQRPVPRPPPWPARSPEPAPHQRGHPATHRRIPDDSTPDLCANCQPGRGAQRHEDPGWRYWPTAGCREPRRDVCTRRHVGIRAAHRSYRFLRRVGQAASLRLRTGGASVFAEYDQHGPINEDSETIYGLDTRTKIGKPVGLLTGLEPLTFCTPCSMIPSEASR